MKSGLLGNLDFSFRTFLEFVFKVFRTTMWSTKLCTVLHFLHYSACICCISPFIYSNTYRYYWNIFQYSSVFSDYQYTDINITLPNHHLNLKQKIPKIIKVIVLIKSIQKIQAIHGCKTVQNLMIRTVSINPILSKTWYCTIGCMEVSMLNHWCYTLNYWY